MERFEVFPVVVAFDDFESLILRALFLAFCVFHGCRLQEVERGGNSGFGPPAHQALSRACGEALLRSVSEVQKAQVVIFVKLNMPESRCQICFGEDSRLSQFIS